MTDTSSQPHKPSDRPWWEPLVRIFSALPRSRENLLKLIRIAYQDNILNSDEYNILEGALKVAGQQVREIMIPVPQMAVLKSTAPLETVIQEIVATGHSRYPMVGETPDEILGIILAKDLLPHAFRSDKTERLQNLARPATFVPESKRLNSLLRDFREKRNHMAIVLDEYGGVAGLVTIEDVLEEIVGEIRDEHDVKEQDSFIRRGAGDEFLINALTPLDTFNEHFGTQVEEKEFETIGGVIMHGFGHMPKRDESIDYAGFRFTVLSADRRRIHLLKIRPLAHSN